MERKREARYESWLMDERERERERALLGGDATFSCVGEGERGGHEG